MRTFLLVFFLFSLQSIIAQDYNKVDSIVNTYSKKFKSIKSFADRISSDFKTKKEKTRAVFYWIANNVTYDYKSLRKKTKKKEY